MNRSKPIYVCIIPHIAFWSPKNEMFVDISYKWQADPYKDDKSIVGSTGICRNSHQASPQYIYHHYLKDTGVDVYFLYKRTFVGTYKSEGKTKKINKGFLKRGNERLENIRGSFYTGLLKVEESYENHKLVPRKYHKFGNVLDNDEKYYIHGESCNPYIRGCWDLNLVKKSGIPIFKPFKESLQETFKKSCNYPGEEKNLPRSFQKTGYWIKATMKELKNYLESP